LAIRESHRLSDCAKRKQRNCESFEVPLLVEAASVRAGIVAAFWVALANALVKERPHWKRIWLALDDREL
jgi:hypothetical protein